MVICHAELSMASANGTTSSLCGLTLSVAVVGHKVLSTALISAEACARSNG